MGVPEYGVAIAEATAIQESKLTNLGYGDRDSLGLFQQRPSEGWGTSQQIMDPVYASRAFYDALLKVSGWQAMPLTVAAQAVQNSGAPDAYAQHQGEAAVLAAVFSGTAGAGVTCTLDGPTFAPQTKARRTCSPRARRPCSTPCGYQFGDTNVGTVSSIAANGLSFDVAPPAQPAGTSAQQLAWAYANWSAAQAEYLGVTQVGYDGRQWDAASGASGAVVRAARRRRRRSRRVRCRSW